MEQKTLEIGKIRHHQHVKPTLPQQIPLSGPGRQGLPPPGPAREGPGKALAPCPDLFTGRLAAPAPGAALGSRRPAGPGPAQASLRPAGARPPPLPHPRGRAGKRFGFLSSPRSAPPAANQRAAPFARLLRRGPISERGASQPMGAKLENGGGDPSGRPRPAPPHGPPNGPPPRPAARPPRTHRAGRRRDLRLLLPAPALPPARPAGGGKEGEGRGGRPEQSERPAAEKQDGGGSVRRWCGGPAPFPPGPAALRRRMTRGCSRESCAGERRAGVRHEPGLGGNPPGRGAPKPRHPGLGVRDSGSRPSLEGEPSPWVHQGLAQAGSGLGLPGTGFQQGLGLRLMWAGGGPGLGVRGPRCRPCFEGEPSSWVQQVVPSPGLPGLA